MMKPADREQWILEYLKAHASGGIKAFVDVTHADFVDEYAEATGAKLKYMMIGAHRCDMLGNDLGRMYKNGTLHRFSTGLESMSGMGFPKWVYMYSIK